MVLLLSRPELVEGEAHVDLSSAERVRLQPLIAEEQAQIARQILGADPPAELIERLRERAAGNPLYLEELLRGLAESGVVSEVDGELSPSGEAAILALPDTIEALLTSRVESLPEAERATLEAAAVAEDAIWPSSMAALRPDRPQREVTAEIGRLVERGFLVRTRSVIADEQQFRFAHVLMREAAYELLTKRRRADLHERLADWLEQTSSSELDFDAAIGRHLAAAHDYGEELAFPQTELEELARRATGALIRSMPECSRRRR